MRPASYSALAMPVSVSDRVFGGEGALGVDAAAEGAPVAAGAVVAGPGGALAGGGACANDTWTPLATAKPKARPGTHALIIGPGLRIDTCGSEQRVPRAQLGIGAEGGEGRPRAPSSKKT